MRLSNLNNINFSAKYYFTPIEVSKPVVHSEIKSDLKYEETKYRYPTGDVILHKRYLNRNLTTFLKYRADGRHEAYQCSGEQQDIPKVLIPYINIDED